jgi:hypothetical protein
MRTLAVGLVVLIPLSAHAADGAADGDAVIDRGTAFLVKDALAWKKEHNCVSCHHAGLVVWALREAKQAGRTVDEPVLADLTKWLAESGSGRTGVPRPEGRPRAFNAKAVYFALALGADREPDEASRKGIKLLLETVQSDQIEDGSWVAWPETRPPFFGGSDDSVTALATLALTPVAATNDDAQKAAREKAVRWIAETKTDDDPQSVAMRLLLWKRLGRSAEECRPLVDRIRERQKEDGGWSQTKEMGSDAWATGQALYALAGAVPADDPAIAKGRAFLIRTQRDDGGWTMTSRPTKPGGEGGKNLIPITGGGSAWGVLGLVRTR